MRCTTLELIDQLGLDKVNLVGISMGGALRCYAFTIHHRRRVRKLVVICPAGAGGAGASDGGSLSKVPPEDIPEVVGERFQCWSRETRRHRPARIIGAARARAREPALDA